MTNSTSTLRGTSIAISSWVDEGGKAHARLYTQDTNGGIWESRYDGDSWVSEGIIATAKPGSPIAACYYRSIHVFYLTTDNLINGIRYDEHQGSWPKLEIGSENIIASPASRLAAAENIDNEEDLPSIYYQTPEGSIGRVRCTPTGWVSKSFFGDNAALGTGLAAIKFKARDGDGIYTATRIFYQLRDGTLTDVGIGRDDRSFVSGESDLMERTKGHVPLKSYLCAISTGRVNGPGTGDNVLLQLYSAYFKAITVMAEWGYYSGKWRPHANPSSIPLANEGGIAVFHDPNSRPAPLLKVYVQDMNNRILEYSAENQWGPWEVSSVVPTGTS